MRYLVILALSLPVFGQQKGRVFLLNVDGLGDRATLAGVASQELHLNGYTPAQPGAEMFWLKLARAGVKVAAHNQPQSYPCSAQNSGQNIALLNGYQTADVAPASLLRGKDVKWLDAAPVGFVPPRQSRRPMRYFEYTGGRVRFTGVVFAQSRRYDTVRMTAYSGKRYVDAVAREAESTPVGQGDKARPLARYFSEALPVANLTAVHFRLFELSEDGSDFLLLQSRGKEIGLCVDGDLQAARLKEKLLASAGAFVGHGAGTWYATDELGKRRTDGVAERRFLETLELHARQTMRHTRALDAQFSPRLLLDRLSTASEMQQHWPASAQHVDKFLDPYRRWGFQIIDWRIHELQQLMRPEDSLLILTGDKNGTVSLCYSPPSTLLPLPAQSSDFATVLLFILGE